MKGFRRRLLGAVLALASGMSAVPAQAALVTLSGSNFDLVYDDALLGLFGAPTLVGDTFFFTPVNFRAESLNGAGAVTTNSTISGLTLIAKNNYVFGSFLLAEFGDYQLIGGGSTVSVAGQLRAFDIANPIFTQTTSNLAVNPLTPLNLNDGINHDWQASASITGSTPVIPGQTNVIASGATSVGLTLENRLTAYTDPSGIGLQQAFIEKKFAGTGITVTVSPVPVPPALGLLVAGLAGLSWVGRRRRAHTPQA